MISLPICHYPRQKAYAKLSTQPKRERKSSALPTHIEKGLIGALLAHVRLEKSRLRQPTSANSPQTGNKRNPRSIDFPKRLHNRTVLPARYCHNAVLHSTIKKYLRTPRTPSRQQSERKQPGNVTILVQHSPINSHRAQASCCSCAEHSSPFLMPPNGVAPRGMVKRIKT